MARAVTVGIDGSPESLAAARWAATESVLRSVPLHLVHAWEWSPAPSASVPTTETQRHWAGRILRAAVEQLGKSNPELQPTSEQISESPVAALLAASENSEILVLGSRGLSAMSGFVTGSVALRVVAQAPRPVGLVRSEGRTAVHSPPRALRPTGASGSSDVVVGVDLAHSCDEVMGFAFEAARVRGVGLHVVHGYTLPSSYAIAAGAGTVIDDSWLAREREYALSTAVDPWRDKNPDVAVRASSVLGQPVAHLVEESVGAPMLVIGRRERTSPLGMHLGSVAHGVMHHAACPVAVVPHS
ncbi:universal stress protein [Streptomyces sp. H27-C3]|uniref:universal stress protein n=1 Tax=Streptomyces sp. H27-C3 TaxID=3046305 RepID=UPI0024B89919|nr:universal stress protein [Streptomyces sp. H27-C3]MDJ0465536.1 universal stress protein [Streptomyces sp. H27-C3]